jgi:hypothetical protein
MYLQMAGLVFMPTGVIVYVINYVDLDRQHLARELDERYEPFHHWGEVPDGFSYRKPYLYRLRDGVVAAVEQGTAPDTEDYRFHYRRLLLMDRVHSALRTQRAGFTQGALPLQDRVLDLAHAECHQLGNSERAGGDVPPGGAFPLLEAIADAWDTTLLTAADRVRMEYADRQDALVQSEVRRLKTLAQVRAVRCAADLDPLFVRFGCHD